METRYADLTAQNALRSQTAKAVKTPTGIRSAAHVCWRCAVKTKAAIAAAVFLTTAVNSKKDLLQNSSTRYKRYGYGYRLNALRGGFVNLKYKLPGGQIYSFWEDDRIYLGNQICKKGSERCYGLTADEHYLLVCEYGANGADAEIVIYKKWR